jgi:hypothetical protein
MLSSFAFSISASSARVTMIRWSVHLTFTMRMRPLLPAAG